MKLILERTCYSHIGTLGKIVHHGREYYTVERPWIDNKINVSCIPEGQYKCFRYSSKKYPETFQVVDVPNWTTILFHVANWPVNVKGCIGLGLKLFPPRSGFGVVQSKNAMARFLVDMQSVEFFDLEIKQFIWAENNTPTVIHIPAWKPSRSMSMDLTYVTKGAGP